MLLKLVEQVRSLKEQVQRMADVMEKREERRQYQAAYYKKRKAGKCKQLPGLSNLDRHCLEGMRDRRLPAEAWGKVLKRFVELDLSPYNFLSWLAWTWNKNTFQHVPITKSGGYMHVLIGLSGDKPLRQKYTERELMGQVKVYQFTKKEQLEFFRGTWGFHVLGSVIFLVIFLVDEEPWFKKLGDEWVKPLRLMMGAYGCYDIRSDLTFDPNESDMHKASKMVGLVRPTLEMCWGACRKGLHSSEEPFNLALR